MSPPGGFRPPVAPTPAVPPVPRRWGLVFVGLLCVAALGSLAFGGILWLLVEPGFSTTSIADDHRPTYAWYDECYVGDGSRRPVDCDGLHHFEVISDYEFYDGEYPDWADRSNVHGQCQVDLRASIEANFSTVNVGASFDVRYPTEREWAQGSTLAICFLRRGGDGWEGRAGTPLP